MQATHPSRRRSAAALLAGLLVATAAGCSGDDAASETTRRSRRTDPDVTVERDRDTTTTSTIADTIASTTTEPADVVQPGWLVVVYEAADNNLEAAILTDVAEMGAVDNPDIDIVVLFDRSSESDRSGGFTDADTAPGIPEQVGSTQLLHAGQGGVSLLGTIEDVDSGDPAVLAEFVEAAVTNYP
ncbi:MAG TPA: hypothetical protein PLV68_16040, partial [Ilumatobacteraceae bacterium]|nr:hypothetical protein [Ilumatobacteraceae bacterium]